MSTPEETAASFRSNFELVKNAIAKVIVGQEDVIEGVLICLLAGGHVLLEGVPGLGKTLLVRTVSRVLDLPFARIQFTPDLMPADITGTDIIVEGDDGRKRYQFQPGPIFAGIILADEINRATPKTQSAMLEAMQEHSVTVGGSGYKLPEPFFVLATQNPIEMEGTYPLPEAQMDRFLFKLIAPSPTFDELSQIIDRTTGPEEVVPEQVLTSEQILAMRRLAREVPIASHVREFAVRLVLATHPGSEWASEMVNRYVRYGASPRGAQALVLAAKIRALLAGRFNVAYDDITHVAPAALRHRILLNFEGLADEVDFGILLRELLTRVTPKRGIPN